MALYKTIPRLIEAMQFRGPPILPGTIGYSVEFDDWLNDKVGHHHKCTYRGETLEITRPDGQQFRVLPGYWVFKLLGQMLDGMPDKIFRDWAEPLPAEALSDG